MLLRWPCRPLSRLRVGLRLPPPTRLCLLRTCATHTWLRSPPRFRPMPDGPPLAFRPNYRTLSNYLLFCISLRFRLTLLLILGPPLGLPMVVGQPRALALFLRPRLARALLRWPQLGLLLLRIRPLALGFLLQLRSLVRCKSLRGPQPVALWSLNFRLSDLPTFLIVFPPGFRLSTPGCMFGLWLYVAVRDVKPTSDPGDYTLSALQVTIVVPILWTPLALAMSGSVLPYAVTVVFSSPDSFCMVV